MKLTFARTPSPGLRGGLRLAAGALVVLAVARCSSGGSQNPPRPPRSTVVGAAGGTAGSSDGSVKISIPNGALPSNVSITLTPTTSPGGGALGTVYEIGPTGTTFAQPVTMTFGYAGVGLGGQSEANLRVATYASGAWQLLPGYVLDTAAHTVSATTTHLSMYALWAPPPASGGEACAAVQVGGGCGSSSGSSSGSVGGSSTGSSSGTGGGSSTGSSSGACPAATCATGAATACGAYPGAVAQSCVDASWGFTANCCFAAGAPICFGVSGGVACAGSGGSSGSSSGTGGGSSTGSSSGGVTCTPDTCAANAATMCAQYPGASMTACTDSANGYQASCCYPAGKPVCVTTGEGAACSGSSSSSSGSSSGSGSGGVSCGPLPTCATSSPCGGVSGTTLQSCTDNANGYSATCCYPVGTLPPQSGGGSSSSGSSSGGSSSGGIGVGGTSSSSSGSSSGG